MRIRIRDPEIFFDPGSGICDTGSGMEKIRIQDPDPQHCACLTKKIGISLAIL